ncbi:hypothetical protein VTL71DRAFT_1201, partial [Oculimacula yallundae]
MKTISPGKGGRKKVKSGCRTCKTRKVKCDERHPICSRCTSTGRVCDGYGIWGGGETFYSQQQRLASERRNQLVSKAPVAVFLPESTAEEKDSFDWFRHRTARKLPGSFVSDFWSVLLFQSSFGEPAVLHAVLALSTIHKEGHFNTDNHEETTLRHYVRAIRDLQPHFACKSKTSSRIALIVCIIFINLELLRGHFQTAQTHLGNGIRILQDMQLISEGTDGVFCDTPSCEAVDRSIIEAFARIQLQSTLSQFGYNHGYLLLELREWISLKGAALKFVSVKQAWGALTTLLNRILRLAHGGQQETNSGKDPWDDVQALQRQQAIRKRLRWWIKTYEASNDILQGLTNGDDQKVGYLLTSYHSLACIMVDTALQPNVESFYDSQTTKFGQLVKQLADLQTISSSQPGLRRLPGHLMDMQSSITDMGWLPVLFFIAIKCRKYEIRYQVVKLLESTSHREGLWDAKTMVCVVRKVIEIEEADFSNDFVETDDYSRYGFIKNVFSDFPCPSDSHRLRGVEVNLVGAPMHTIKLFCRRFENGNWCRILLSEYRISTQQWTDF